MAEKTLIVLTLPLKYMLVLSVFIASRTEYSSGLTFLNSMCLGSDAMTIYPCTFYLPFLLCADAAACCLRCCLMFFLRSRLFFFVLACCPSAIGICASTESPRYSSMSSAVLMVSSRSSLIIKNIDISMKPRIKAIARILAF